MRASKDYTDELEKLRRDDSELVLKVSLKALATRKWNYEYRNIYKENVSIFLLNVSDDECKTHGIAKKKDIASKY